MIVTLKYKDDVVVEKLIPKKYEQATASMRLSYFEKPENKRLTPMERFIMAELAWRFNQSSLTKWYLSDCVPTQVNIQENRASDTRFIVRYKNEKSGLTAQAKVPVWVFNACPKDKISRELIDW